MLTHVEELSEDTFGVLSKSDVGGFRDLYTMALNAGIGRKSCSADSSNMNVQ